jgi:tRNA nucleotidyltransferase (CCA-adding enzyme)
LDDSREGKLPVHIILAHENADFDAVAALLAAHKLNPLAVPVLPEQQNRNVAAFLALYVGGLPFVGRDDIDIGRVEQITLVDTQRLPQIKRLPNDAPVLVIDHHPVQDEPDARYTLTGDVIGSTTTLLTEQIQAQNIALTSLEATLLALGIYEDTGALTYGGTTPRDARAAAWLLEQHADLDTVRRFLTPPLTDEQQALYETLLVAAETRTIEGYTVVVSAAKVERYVTEVAAIAHRLREMLDPAGLFLLVQMPSALHLVARASDDAVDAGQVARFFGGGGHERAASASLHDHTYEEAIPLLWEQIRKAVRPAVRVADLMSYGVQTIDADKPINAVVRQMRRIGHEGFPVIEDGRIVGLLTRRDADRAVEHGLGEMAVREVMSAGDVTLKPDDSVGALEQTMVESGWGQIPVVDGDGRLIGIVTRTDLISHWAQKHPASPPMRNETLTLAQIETVLGKPVATLIEKIAGHAQYSKLPLYMVGGVVRDLLLQRRNLDVDFVVEGDAIKLAESLSAKYGGQVNSFRPFGTAKWLLDEAAARALGVPYVGLPENVDFATARNEFYEHPTALPTVYSGSIKLDLARRDFTINTLAVQFSPASATGRILDFFGGVKDLRAGVIRVLHNLSFVDDPTRILRAVRFEQRLGFTIGPRTSELMKTAAPMLRRITGERVRNELTMLLRESEPERGLLKLQEPGLLAAIHPSFQVGGGIARQFGIARTTHPAWPMPKPDMPDLYWHIIAADIPADELPALCERLLFSRDMTDSMQEAARLVQDVERLHYPDARPSQIDDLLHGIPELALLAAWLLIKDERVRERITLYVTRWRDVRPATDGNTLREMGLKPGPCYAVILHRLRAARLDGEIDSDAGEGDYVRSLLEQGVCHDGA